MFQGAGSRLQVAEVFAYGPDEAVQAESGAEAARAAYEAVREGALGRCGGAVRRRGPPRAPPGLAPRRVGPGPVAGGGAAAWLDVESLDDGGPDLVQRR